MEDSGGPGQSPDAERDSRIGEYLVARGRVQLPTFALGVRCSMQLSYRATLGYWMDTAEGPWRPVVVYRGRQPGKKSG